ncbi:MAG: ankyrin repeat domain-containing protein [Methylovirgula sp.]
MNAVPFRRIGFDIARDLLGKPDILLLDVRDPASFERGHIARAENASPINLGRFLTETPKEKPVLIYCYHGNSSQAYAKAFSESGFGEVYSLDGGYEGWATANARAAAAAPRLSDTLKAFLTAQGFPPDDVNAVGKNQMTPLMQAAHLGPAALVAELLAAGARVDAMNSDGSQPLWLACVGDDPEIVALVIKAGADLEHKNVNGSTALMYAASASKAKALKVLLEAGADLTYENDGFSALDMAASRECLDLLRAAQRRAKAAS